MVGKKLWKLNPQHLYNFNTVGAFLKMFTDPFCTKFALKQ